MSRKHKTLSKFLILVIILSILPLSNIIYAGTENPYLSGGMNHSVFLDGNGDVWTWGYNQWGEIGDSTYKKRANPYKVMSGMDVKTVSAGNGYTMALKRNGDLWVWGWNAYGQLGLGINDNDAYTPVKVPGMNSVKTVIASYIHTMLIMKDGTVWGSGSNGFGQLGDGSLTNRNAFTMSTLLTDVKELATGLGYTLVIKNDKSLWALGSNNYGQIGNGSTASIAYPVQLTGMNNVKGIAAGGDHSVAVKEDGTVWTWGENTDGQLGIGTTIHSSVPVQVSGITNAKAVAAGFSYTLALKDDGTVWACGDNTFGQLGDGTYLQRESPVQVQGLKDIVAITATSYSSLALKSDGTVWAWGYSLSGNIGNGTNSSNVPVQVQGLPVIPVKPPSQKVTENVIIPEITTDLNKYIQGDTVVLKVKLTGTKPSDKTNSISFKLDYDSNTFALVGGNLQTAEKNGYIPFGTKSDLVQGSVKTINLTYKNKSKNISLQEGAAVFTVRFKVKQNAKAGIRNFTLKPVNMTDSGNNAYNINDKQPVTKTVEITNDAVIEGYVSIYLGDKGSNINNIALGSLNQSKINDTFRALMFELRKGATNRGTVIINGFAFIPDENRNLAAKDSKGKVKGRFRIYTPDPSYTSIKISGEGYLFKNYNISLKLSRPYVISTAAAPIILYPGDLQPDGKINKVLDSISQFFC